MWQKTYKNVAKELITSRKTARKEKMTNLEHGELSRRCPYSSRVFSLCTCNNKRSLFFWGGGTMITGRESSRPSLSTRLWRVSEMERSAGRPLKARRRLGRKVWGGEKGIYSSPFEISLESQANAPGFWHDHRDLLQSLISVVFNDASSNFK